MARPFHNRKRRGGSVGELPMYEHPGKYEGELALVEYLDGMGADEWEGDDNGGENYAIIRGPFDATDDGVVKLNRAERRFIKRLAGVILHTSSTGFVTPEYFYRTEPGKSAMEERWQEIQDEYLAPTYEDLVTEDHRNFYRYGMDDRKPVVSVEDGDDWRAAVKAYMDKTRYWPNVWFISDHGNAHLMDLSGDK